MQQSWRWFGPEDPVPLDHIRQAGAEAVVTSLHQVPTGEAWTDQAVEARKQEIEGENGSKSPLYWTVVESVNVHDDIKLRAPGHEKYVDAFCDTLRVLGRHGVRTVCYNFMPLIDWTRTDLMYQLPSGARALRFDADRFAVFDLHILQREGAAEDYSDDMRRRAVALHAEMDEGTRSDLARTILAGLPGGTTGAHTLDGFRNALARYETVSDGKLRENLFAFLRQVIPVAAEAGVRLAIHPDDPPRRLLGLPRVICSADDVRRLFAEIEHPNNGLTLCAGTFGVRADNDLPAMAKEFAERIYFAHLRGTRREGNPLSFHEAEHLNSDVDMLSVIEVLLNEEARRQESGNLASHIAVRPDHGHLILDDLEKAGINPGYSAIGRLKGLAEIRGAIAAFQHMRGRQA